MGLLLGSGVPTSLVKSAAVGEKDLLCWRCGAVGGSGLVGLVWYGLVWYRIVLYYIVLYCIESY